MPRDDHSAWAGLPQSLILSQPDRLGDALITLPMAGWIKRHAPQTRLIVLCRRHIEPVWRDCPDVDEVILLEDLEASDPVERLRAVEAQAIVHLKPLPQVARWAREARIPKRIGTAGRLFHWTTCNIRPSFRRRGSGLHAAVLHARLLEPFGVRPPLEANALAAHGRIAAPPAPSQKVRALLDASKRNVVIHPMTGGGALPWGLENFAALIASLDSSRYHLILTPSAGESKDYRDVLPIDRANVVDAGGLLDLGELMQLVGAADALVAASTGPLHLAAVYGRRAIALHTMRDHASPQRWGPLGPDAHALVFDPNCPACARDDECDCIQRINPLRVVELLER